LTREGDISGVVLTGGFSQSPIIRRTIQQATSCSSSLKASSYAGSEPSSKGSSSSPASERVDTKTKMMEEEKRCRGEMDGIVLREVENPETSVVLGAVLHGLNRDLIRSRVMRYSIGFEWCVRVNGASHKPSPYCLHLSRPNTTVDDPICHGHFRPIVKAGDIITVNQTYESIAVPALGSQSEMQFRFFMSEYADVERIDDPTKPCRLLQKVSVQLPDLTTDGEQRSIVCQLSVSGPILNIKIIDTQSNRQTLAKFSFIA
jgi:hypothetical protein